MNMKKKSFIRIVVCLLICAFLIFSPGYLVKTAERDSYLENLEVSAPKWQGMIVIYHIVTHKTYQGSVTYYLKTQAEAFERKNRGVFIQVVGMDEATYLERLSYGRRPDAYSFYAGTIYSEQLQPIDTEFDGFIEGLPNNELVTPYFFSGYVSCKNEAAKGDGIFVSSDLQAARLGILSTSDDNNGFVEGRCKNTVVDLRRFGDIKRSEKIADYKMEAVDTFTDIVCYIGVSKDTDSDKAYWIERFISWLLEDKAQQELTSLGAFSVKRDCEQVFAANELNQLKKTYCTVSTVDPFVFYSNRAALFEEAQRAIEGDESAKKRFLERLSVVLFK